MHRDRSAMRLQPAMRSSRATVATSVLATTAGVFPGFLTGAVSVQLGEDLGVGPATTGVLVALFFAVGAVVSGPGGRLAEHVGAVPGLRAATATTAGVLVTLAVAAQNTVHLGAGLAVAGVANAVVQPAVNGLLVGAIPTRRRGLAFGIKQSGVPASTLLGGLVVPTLAVTLGWRAAFAAGAAVAFLAAVVIHGHAETVPAASSDAARPVLSPWLLMVALGTALGAAAGSVLGVFTVASAVSADVPAGVAGVLLTAGSLTAIAVRVVMGSVVDRTGGGFGTVAAMLAAGSVGYVLLAGGGGVWLLTTGVLVAFGLGWGWNGVLNFAVADTHADRPAAATGITQAGVYVGGTVGPAAFGVAAQSFGFPPAWVATAGVSLVAAVLMFIGYRLAPAARRPTNGRGHRSRHVS
ncbi:MAG: MFS transporter [Nitriliruptorales bacterium]|nr:MFS transporter [Nitriliruptorales bacterium]